MPAFSREAGILLRRLLLWTTPALPFVTGFTAAILKFPDPWKGIYEGFADTFINYFVPFPMAMGMLQWIAWPTTFGVLIAFSFLPWRKWIGLFYVIFCACFVLFVDDELFVQLFFVTDVAISTIVVGIWYAINLRNRASLENPSRFDPVK